MKSVMEMVKKNYWRGRKKLLEGDTETLPPSLFKNGLSFEVVV